MKGFTVLLASLVLGTPTVARSYNASHDECHKLQTEWFDAMISVCNGFRSDDVLKESICPHHLTDKRYPNWASYREVIIAARTKECAAITGIR
jgi:hypothetical protein